MFISLLLIIIHFSIFSSVRRKQTMNDDDDWNWHTMFMSYSSLNPSTTTVYINMNKTKENAVHVEWRMLNVQRIWTLIMMMMMKISCIIEYPYALVLGWLFFYGFEKTEFSIKWKKMEIKNFGYRLYIPKWTILFREKEKIYL